MVTAPLADVKAHLSAYVDRADRQHVRTTITRNGRPGAVLLAAADLEALEQTLAILSDPEAMADIATTDAELTRGEPLMPAAEMSAILTERARVERG